MQLQHHSTVELIDRLVERGLLHACAAPTTAGRFSSRLTRDGEQFLKTLSLHHLEELRSTGPKFVKILQSLIENADLDRNGKRRRLTPARPKQKRTETMADRK